ncbi:hypothetical protein [Streptomonospora mangrovi]|nr:hypothetical protein [Streptomonospora mangrovi]
MEYEWQSDFAKKYVGIGREEGREEGLEEGREKGLEEGRVQAQSRAVLEVLRARGIEVSERQREVVLSCEDLDRLRVWLVRAATAEDATDVFGR